MLFECDVGGFLEELVWLGIILLLCVVFVYFGVCFENLFVGSFCFYCVVCVVCVDVFFE